MEACKQQNHGSMEAAELWKHVSSRTMVAWKQQNYGSMEAAEPWLHASSRTMDCSSIEYSVPHEERKIMLGMYDITSIATIHCT